MKMELFGWLGGGEMRQARPAGVVFNVVNVAADCGDCAAGRE